MLKWLHHLEEKNVMLLHWVESWHDWEHAARSLTRPDPLLKYSLLAASHALPDIVTEALAAGVVG